MKGLLANLITVRDVSYATGLEVVAGGRLYNIVVDTEVGVHVILVQWCLGVLVSFADQWDSVTGVGDVFFVFEQVTGKKLLEKGELQRRYTIIPLNKISAKTLNDRVVNAAKSLVRDLNTARFGKSFCLIKKPDCLQWEALPHSVLFSACPFFLFCQVGEDNVHTALSLVGYESDLRKAMEYVFGSTLVCDTLDNAKKVAFDKQVMTKTVTLGGDIFDPQGTLSGGENIY